MIDIMIKDLWRVIPHPEINQFLSDASEEESQEIRLPEIWCTNRSRLPPLPTAYDAQRVKILYLVSLAKAYGHIRSLGDLLGLPKIDVSAFDRICTLEHLGGVDRDADEVEQVMPRDALLNVNLTGDPRVDFWLRLPRA